MPNYGVIDLGSNSVRLVIYDVKNTERCPITTNDFKSLLNDKVMAGLASYVNDGVFSQAGIERAINVLKGHAKRLKYFNCVRTEVFATAVLRNCINSAEAIKAIESATGMHITLLSAREEAHLGFRGARCANEIDDGTLIDIGGGSTELTSIKGGIDTTGISIPQGSLSSYAGFVQHILPSQEEGWVIASAFAEKLHSLENFADFRAKRLYGIGGSVRAAAKMMATIEEASERPRVLTVHSFEHMRNLLEEDPASFAHFAARAVPERIHTLMPGCIIAKTVLEELGADSIEICKHGIREGYLIERMLQ